MKVKRKDINDGAVMSFWGTDVDQLRNFFFIFLFFFLRPLRSRLWVVNGRARMNWGDICSFCNHGWLFMGICREEACEEYVKDELQGGMDFF